MFITSLTLEHFRNYEQQQISFSPHTNVIYGNNAQGKTNILEAVYLFSHGRSHRAHSDKELIRFGEAYANLEIDFEDSSRNYNASIRLLKNGKKSVKVNHVAVNRLSKLMNYLNVVMFSPEDLDLVKGSPGGRRRFLDAAISQLYPGYLNSLITYHKALTQKNSLLKMLRQKGWKSDPTLSVWNEQLAGEAEKIMRYRRDFLTPLSQFAAELQKEISGEVLEVRYQPSIHAEQSTEIFEVLESHQAREIDCAAAQSGIQRDDISISVSGNAAKTYGSQGQQRTAILSLKLAQADLIHSLKEEYPVLLLDDIMSELDLHRRLYLSEKIKNKQVLITCTDTDLTKDSATQLFHVEEGRVCTE